MPNGVPNPFTGLSIPALMQPLGGFVPPVLQPQFRAQLGLPPGGPGFGLGALGLGGLGLGMLPLVNPFIAGLRPWWFNVGLNPFRLGLFGGLPFGFGGGIGPAIQNSASPRVPRAPAPNPPVATAPNSGQGALALLGQAQTPETLYPLLEQARLAQAGAAPPGAPTLTDLMNAYRQNRLDVAAQRPINPSAQIPLISPLAQEAMVSVTGNPFTIPDLVTLGLRGDPFAQRTLAPLVMAQNPQVMSALQAAGINPQAAMDFVKANNLMAGLVGG